MKPFKVAIVGRPNVGKSSLFNQLISRRLSIVDDREGVTRDRIESAYELAEGHGIYLVDTGGMGLQTGDEKLFDINEQIDAAIEDADLFIMMVDVRSGILPADRQVAERLRRTQKPVILLVNKTDTHALEQGVADAWELGFDEPMPYSVSEARGLDDLIEKLISMTPKVPLPQSDDLPRVAVLGKRNSGKSTLINLMCQNKRVIVSDKAGTTRDFVEVQVDRYARPFIAVDTAGVMRPHYETPVDFFSMKRTEKALVNCQAAILMVDASEKIGMLDKKLANLLRVTAKPTVVVVNKWDLADSSLTTGEFMRYLDQQLKGIAYAPVAFISALNGENVRQMIKTLFEVIDQGSVRVPTGELNRILEAAVSQQSPPSRFGQQAKLLYVSQVDVCPPTFVIKCNDGRLISKNYSRYLENCFRKAMKSPEIPLKLKFRGKKDLD